MSSLLALLVVCSSIVAISQCQPFLADVSTADLYEFGMDVTCKVTITNSHDCDYYLLRRNTPLEPINSNIFLVARGEHAIRYNGLLYQRDSPTPDEYILVPAKSSVSVTVDLSRSYNFNAKTSYSVQLYSELTYYKHGDSNTTNQHIVSNKEHFTMVGSEVNSRRTEAGDLQIESLSIKTLDVDLSDFVTAGSYVPPAFAGTPQGADIQTTLAVYGAVYNILVPSNSAVDSNQYNLYSTWFGVRYSGYMDTVKGAYLNIKSAMERYQYTMYFDGPECLKIQNVIAYTYKGSNVSYLPVFHLPL